MMFYSILDVFFLVSCRNKALQKNAHERPARDPHQVKKHKKLVQKNGLLLVISGDNMVKKISKVSEENPSARPLAAPLLTRI